MLYMGSKNRIAKHLIPIIQSYITENTKGYLEPFVGGANVIDKIKHDNKIGYDINEYLIECLKYLRDGWVPPCEVSREEYYNIKNNKDIYSKHLVGYVGFQVSFGAKWFNGYMKRDDKKKYGDIYSYKHCMNQAPNLKGTNFKCCDFRNINKEDVKGYVIYCDIPYRGTTKYKTDEFPYEEFYEWVKEMSTHNTVLVSEYNMPDDFTCIWEKKTSVSLHSKRDAGEVNTRVEKLFIYKKKEEA